MPRLRANDNGAIRTKSDVLKTVEKREKDSKANKQKRLTLTAENFFLSAHTLCGLNARPSPGFVSKEGAEKVNTSPFDERAAKVSSQHVIFEI